MRDFNWLVSAPIAHRGLFDTSLSIPENSLAAFRRAAERDIPIELDVQLAHDGTLVVLHDATLERMTGSPLHVSQIGRVDLGRLRLGDSGEPVPTLEQALEVIDGRIPVVIDVRRWSSELSPRLERAVAARIQDYRGPVALQSFDPLAVYRLRRLIKDRPVGQVSGALRSASWAAALIGRTMVTNLVTSPDFIAYEFEMLPSPYATLWQRRGVPLLAWTITSAETEARATRVADNFYFDGYLPVAHRGSTI
ncbi:MULTISPECIES: glycerophosphodiester phosphodiesterase family protein [unclassified Streptomyces]|uniref:glycerophosphodiester phosphodiesterase family protein n=1 Tax=unclassified Streptomyces TaxID=2593676 RepID=UPI002E145673|nr:glycerophosphodiester phosphodiesterase family protein [Streptomyces sp. NBC_01320]